MRQSKGTKQLYFVKKSLTEVEKHNLLKFGLGLSQFLLLHQLHVFLVLKMIKSDSKMIILLHYSRKLWDTSLWKIARVKKIFRSYEGDRSRSRMKRFTSRQYHEPTTPFNTLIFQT
jgi:hypothetical protein